MADVLRGDDQDDGGDGEDGVEVELGQVELGQGEELGLRQRGKVHQVQSNGGEVAADHGDEEGDDGEELAEEDGAEDGHTQGDGKDGDVGAGGEVGAGLAGGDGVAGQLQADEGHHGAHGGGGQDDVDPLGAELPDEEGQQAAQQAHHHEAALGVLKALGGDDAAGGGQEGEAGAQIGRGLALGEEDEEQGAEAVHEEDDAGVDLEQDGDQHRRAEHGEDVLDAQGQQHGKGDFLIHLDDTFLVHGIPLLSIAFRASIPPASHSVHCFWHVFSFSSHPTESPSPRPPIPPLRRLTKTPLFL